MLRVDPKAKKPDFVTFADAEQVRRYIRKIGAPIVVKSGGLAAGKAVFVCVTVEEALGVVAQIMEERIFGDAGNQVVVEEFLRRNSDQ